MDDPTPELTSAAYCVLAWIDRKNGMGRRAAERLERALAAAGEAGAQTTDTTPAAERYRVVWVDDAITQGLPGAEAYSSSDFGGLLYDFSTEPPSYVGDDISEPEDKLLTRDFRWVAEELNRLAGERFKLLEAAPRCRQCGKRTEPQRWCYATPICLSCLPPPPPIATVELTKKEGSDV